MSLIAKNAAAVPQERLTPEEKRAKALAYSKMYRETHAEQYRAKERNLYYKKRYALSPEFVEQYGRRSGDVFKILKAFRQLTRDHPELSPHVLALLQSDEQPTVSETGAEAE